MTSQQTMQVAMHLAHAAIHVGAMWAYVIAHLGLYISEVSAHQRGAE